MRELRELRRRAGNPSLGVLSRRTGIPRSTLFDALDPKRVTLPAWDTVRALVVALGCSPAEQAWWTGSWRETKLGETVPSRPGRLPAAPQGFTGRDAELALLDKAHDEAAGCAVALPVISGVGGIGKTWLALSWAHRRLESFPDGQLYVDLRGFDPAAEPMPPGDALGVLLEALGVAAAAIPPRPDAQAGLYRSILAGKRVLIILDNARDTSQVVPLLPGGPHATVVVTSRHRLPGLVSSHGAVAVGLGPLSEAESRRLLARRLGAERLSAEPEATTALLRMCDGLPLAVGIVAARAGDRPLAHLLAEPSLHTGLRGVLDASLRALDEPAASLLRLLAQVPGPDIGLAGVAALAGSRKGLRRALRELDNAHLVEEHAPGRFRLHDLVRQHAVQGPPPDRQALRRLLSHYSGTARAHNSVLEVFTSEPQSRPEARAWFEAEWPCLLAAVATARRHGWVRLAFDLSCAAYLWQTRPPGTLELNRVSLELAQQLEDDAALGIAHRNLGRTLVVLAEHGPGIGHLDEALAAFVRAGDVLEQAMTESSLSWAWDRRHDRERAVRHAERALELFTPLDDPLWTARALNNLGWCHSHLGRLDLAEQRCRQALQLCREHGYAELEIYVWHSLGVNQMHAGRHRRALTYLRASLDRGRRLDSRQIEPTCLLNLGNAYRALGEDSAARQVWLEALGILRAQHRLEEVAQVEQRLGRLSRPGAQ